MPFITDTAMQKVATKLQSFETGTTRVRLALAAVLDVPLLHTPYDADRGANAKQLAEPWSVRPGAALALAFRPEFGWF